MSKLGREEMLEAARNKLMESLSGDALNVVADVVDAAVATIVEALKVAENDMSEKPRDWLFIANEIERRFGP